ncbi:hypothetical protein [Leptospira neocaledonica]|uniref:hypothetical protein n=1 Tax=Leptospira neocaledonica TaxID=2023192 RepID=UPI000F652565|nr:hypothetical protein [Leptospira neocaledonica]
MEPLQEFRQAGAHLYSSDKIKWVDDSLPSLAKLSKLIGIFAFSFLNGPAGRGTYVFPTDGKRSIDQASKLGLKNLLIIENQPSLMKNKEDVTWTRLVFRKI